MLCIYYVLLNQEEDQQGEEFDREKKMSVISLYNKKSVVLLFIMLSS